MLTKIAYQAIGKINQLPPPLDEDNNIQFHQKPYHQKVKPDKADKRKRDSTNSTAGSQAKKMRGQLFGAHTEEEKDETQVDSHDDQQRLLMNPMRTRHGSMWMTRGNPSELETSI